MVERPDFRADNAPKQFFDGTHRTISPEETIERVRPHFKRMGLTRIADLTGLDRIGLPVAQAVRPAARSLSVNQGKGRSKQAAWASAVMESTETWHAEMADLDPVYACCGVVRDMAQCADLAAISSAPDVSAEELEGTELGWVFGWDLISDLPMAVPFDSVHMNYTQRQQTRFVHRTSNGLASGNTLAEATVGALLELVERDANADFKALPEPAKRQRRLSLASLQASLAWPIVQMIQEAGLWLEVREMTNSIGIPVFAAMLFEGRGAPEGGIPRPFYGAGCHLDADVALSRAITEAVQSRLTVISGVREDLGPVDYKPISGSMLSLMSSTSFGAQEAPSFCPTDASGPTALDDLTTIRTKLEAVGLSQIVVVDLSIDDIGIPVVRAVVPGLGGPAVGGEYRRGHRHFPEAMRAGEAVQ